MFPFYYGWLPNSKTASVLLLAQEYPEVVSSESYNGEFNPKCTKKPFSDGFLANLRPL